MLDFRLEEEQRMLADAIHRFAGEEMRKEVRQPEESGRLPDKVILQGWDIALLSAAMPEAYGGLS